VTVTHERDGRRVAAEWFDVLFDPVQSSNEVQQGVVSGSVAVAGAEETCKRLKRTVNRHVELPQRAASSAASLSSLQLGTRPEFNVEISERCTRMLRRDAAPHVFTGASLHQSLISFGDCESFIWLQNMFNLHLWKGFSNVIWTVTRQQLTTTLAKRTGGCSMCVEIRNAAGEKKTKEPLAILLIQKFVEKLTDDELVDKPNVFD
jgi:hypothetical protein